MIFWLPLPNGTNVREILTEHVEILLCRSYNSTFIFYIHTKTYEVEIHPHATLQTICFIIECEGKRNIIQQKQKNQLQQQKISNK